MPKPIHVLGRKTSVYVRRLVLWCCLCAGIPLALAAPLRILIDFTRYFPHTPGLVFDFQSVNHRTGVTGQTRIELEAETAWCGWKVIPWRFTKTAADLYWAPGLEWDLRWMVVAPDENNVPLPTWTRAVWVLGDQRYQRTGTLEIGTQVVQTVLSRSLSGYPPSLLGMTDVALPFETHDDTGQNYLVPDDATACPMPQLAPAEASLTPTQTPHGPSLPVGWRMKMDWASVTVPGIGYRGPALRVDYWEGYPGPLETAPGLLRESWYFIRDIGVVEIRHKQFGVGQTKLCLEDADCTRADMADPDGTSTLLVRSVRTPRGMP